MKKRIANLTLLILVALALIACEQPYVMTNDLGGQTLSYSDAPSSTETWTFAKDGKSGTVELRSYVEEYPTAAAATEGRYDGKEWYQCDGIRGRFTYDPKTLQVTIQYTEVFELKPNTPAISYKEDYEWKNMAKLAEEYGAYSVTISESYTTTFTQDNRLEAYVAASNSYKTERINTRSIINPSGVTDYIYKTTKDWMIQSSVVAYSNKLVRTTKTNGSVTSVQSFDDSSTYELKSALELGATKTGASFTDTWQKGKTVSFNLLRTSEEAIQYEGTSGVGTPPHRPTVDETSGIGTNGTPAAIPLSYYSIDKRPSYTSKTFVHRGDFITEMPYTAHRGIGF